MASSSKPRCKSLVLDAGPLLSLAPLRGLAETFYTVPQVLEELKDKSARQHLQQLGLKYGVKIELKNPSPASLATSKLSVFDTLNTLTKVVISYSMVEEDGRLLRPISARYLRPRAHPHPVRRSERQDCRQAHRGVKLPSLW